MTHLTDKEINGYIHHSLTDAQRETMDRHIQNCVECRTALQSAEQLRRQIAYGLADEMRQMPPSGMNFGQIRIDLNKRRRWATYRFHSMQLLSTMGTMAALFVFVLFGIYLLQTAVIARPRPASSSDVNVAANIVKLFAEPFDDPGAYEDGLIKEQAGALELLSTAPVYHIDMEVSEDLRQITGRQQLRFVNQAHQPLSSLVLHLTPNPTMGPLAIYDVEVDGRPVEYDLLANEQNVRIGLPEAINPGETAVIEMTFEMGTGRTLTSGADARQPERELLHLEQFHPALAVYDEELGWDLTAPNHNLSPNAVPSFYRARITIPEGKDIVGSGQITGEARSASEISGQKVVTLAAGPVDEFYVTISEPFQVFVSDTVGETKITSYAHTQAQVQEAQAALEYAKTALRLYDRQFGSYPFRELDLINVPSLAYVRQGAAYSGVVLLEHDPYLYLERTQEHVILFLIASLWFDPAVSSTRLENPWLADGLAEYATIYFYQADADEKGLLELFGQWQMQSEPGDPYLGNPADAYGDLTYYNITHGQTPIFLHAIAEEMGQAQFNEFLADYTRTYRWGGANTAVFQQLAEQSCACDLSAIFTDWVIDPGP